MSTQPPPIPQGQPVQPLPYATPQMANKVCPRCGQPAARQMKFTWWGGALGPKLFNHHKCDACKYTFNGKTGLPNTTAITIYVVVGAILGLAVGLAIAFMR